MRGSPPLFILWRDFTPGGALLTAALAGFVLIAGIVAATETRTLFLSLATFHGWLEMALLGFFVARDGIGSRQSACARAPA